MTLSRRTLLTLLGGSVLSSPNVFSILNRDRAYTKSLTEQHWSRVRGKMLFPHHVPPLNDFGWFQQSISLLRDVEGVLHSGHPISAIAAALDQIIELEAERTLLVEVEQWIMTPTELGIFQIDNHFGHLASVGLER